MYSFKRDKSLGRPSWVLRVAIPVLLIAVWMIGGAVGGPYFGKIDEVSSNDLATFLPKNAESTRAKDELAKFQTSGTIPALVVFESNNKLTTEQKAKLDQVRNAFIDSGEVKGDVSPAVVSEDQKAAFLVAPLDSEGELPDTVGRLQEEVKKVDPGIDYKVTGPAMFSRDLNKAFAGIDGTLLFVALGVVFVILLIVYRSPVLPVVTLMSAILALSVAILVVWHGAKAGLVQLNGQVQGILFILVIGAATDYALLYIARYREELTHHESTWAATKAAWKSSWEPIVAAGGTVALGLLCLLVSDLGSNRALGPVGGLGILFAIISALTFLPATLLLFGRAAFWPRKPGYVEGKELTDYHDNYPLWAKVGEFVRSHPRPLWIGITLLLVVGCLFAPQLRAEGVNQSQLIIGKSEARDGQEMLDRHFPAGSGSPTVAIVPANVKESVVRLLENDRGVESVSVMTGDPTKSSMPVGKAREQMLEKLRDSGVSEQMLARIDPFAGLTAKEMNGNVVLQATLRDIASSVEARQTVERLRTSVQKEYPSALFGGVSAIQLDTNNASQRDLKLIIPLILVAITIVLMLLLRSIVAPLVLLTTTVLSFGATLGLAALMFNNVWQFAGADPSVIIFGFVFLVALGIDYNIFLMTRVREESLRINLREGTIKALVVTGGVITSAGVVLASTFAALNVIPILFLAQIAFIVAFGVLFDTFIVRSLLVPSLTLEIGPNMWWPSKKVKK